MLDNICNGPITDEVTVSAAIIILGYWSGRWRVACFRGIDLYEIKPDVLAAHNISLSFRDGGNGARASSSSSLRRVDYSESLF